MGAEELTETFPSVARGARKAWISGGAHFSGVALVVEEDETAHSIHVGLLGAVGVMFELQGFAELVQKFLSHG